MKNLITLQSRIDTIFRNFIISKTSDSHIQVR